jgi:hypothetical protein
MKTSLGLLLLAVAAVLTTPALPAVPAAANAAQLTDSARELFDARLARYVVLRDEKKAFVQLPFEPNDEWTALIRRRRLGQTLRAERENVGPGNIFGGIVGRWFGAMCGDVMQSDAFRRWLQDREYPRLRTYVNEQYPLLAGHDVPFALLQILPDLPPGIMYRVVGVDLVLWDEQSDLVIDVLRDAFGSRITN